MVFQIQITKRQGVVPMTRDYILQRSGACVPPKAGSARRCGWPASSQAQTGARGDCHCNSVNCGISAEADCACRVTRHATPHSARLALVPWHPLNSTARKLPEPAAPTYRTAPHNIEAEQALLGAILVNNEALYRVADFLEPQHFFEPIHQKIFELARSLIRAGKLATPVTLKTFLPGDIDIAGMNVSQYLARLAAEATTVINAEDYGRTIYDLVDPPRS